MWRAVLLWLGRRLAQVLIEEAARIVQDKAKQAAMDRETAAQLMARADALDLEVAEFAQRDPLKLAALEGRWRQRLRKVTS